ncbi:MAG: cupin domain-containing protein [Dongiaceae bacterium]
MPFIPASKARIFELPGARFAGLAAPSSGARENSVWMVTLQPGAPVVPHALTREETFVAVAGAAKATIAGEEHDMTVGSALVVPAGVEFGLANPHDEPFQAVVVMPVGGQAMLANEAPFTPPWAQ